MPPDLYPILLAWSPEDSAWIATVPDLPGCLADGVTRAKAALNATDAIAAWLDTARELGRDLPEPTLYADA